MANNATLGDDRIKRDTSGAGRDDRSTADSERTDKDGTAFSAPERRTNFRDEWAATATSACGWGTSRSEATKCLVLSTTR
jgi:hypothetical protein